MGKITGTLVKKLRRDIEAALAEISTKHGITKIDLGRITYTDDGSVFSSKLTGFDTDEAGLTPEGKAFQDRKYLHPEFDLGDKFEGHDGTIYKIYGFNTRARKKPYLIQDGLGRILRAPKGYILQQMGIE